MEYIKLGDIATYINGYSFKPSDWKTEGTPIVRIQNLTGFNGNYNYTDKEVDSKYKIKRGDILISWSASIGVYEWEGEDAFLNQHIFKVEFNKICINKQYFKYAVEQSLDKAIKFMHGSTMKHITKKYFDNILIPVPNLEQQEKIVKILNKAESLINMKRAQLDYQDELVKSRFVEMFGDPITNSKKLEVTNFENVVRLQRGFDLPTYERDISGKYNVWGSNGILSKHSNYKVNEPGIITGRSGSLGKVFYTIEPYWPLNTTLFSKETYGNNVIYLSYLLKFYKLQRFSNGTGVPTLNRNLLEGKKIINVSKNEQNKFADFVIKVDKLKFEMEKSLKELEDNFNSLMQKAFKGELF
ncbi:restriction endonuclease subunit S [Intestinibacter bartlettii]|uniref:restriction endonuclease subunit S n=1 Tax=Intestinibacter bartlettii TaxID=261299 RepID=UPI0008213FF8|nr:restriction endonuclease subunit S [Intestinibacter bartlettii]SCI85228.1 Type I restriction modification DNA specificity domain [uncultured Clostridium sp.]